VYAIQMWDVEAGTQRTIQHLPAEFVQTDDQVLKTIAAFTDAMEDPQCAAQVAPSISQMPVTAGWPRRGILVCSQSPVAPVDRLPHTGARGAFTFIVRREVPWPGEELQCLQA